MRLTELENSPQSSSIWVFRQPHELCHDLNMFDKSSYSQFRLVNPIFIMNPLLKKKTHNPKSICTALLRLPHSTDLPKISSRWRRVVPIEMELVRFLISSVRFAVKKYSFCSLMACLSSLASDLSHTVWSLVFLGMRVPCSLRERCALLSWPYSGTRVYIVD